MLKLVAIWGAEFYYAGFFSLGTPFSPSENWCFQAAMPAYSQAVSSSYADVLFEDGSHPVLAGFQGAYIAGRENTFGPNPAVSASPWLWAGAPNRIAVARKAAAKQLYVIAGAVERKSNQMGNSRAVVNVSILLPTGPMGAGSTRLQFEVRLQGSVYVYDATASKPKFYQIDAWHEAQHPSFWSRHSVVEAEVFRTHLRNHLAIHTEVPARALVGDYRVFTSFVATCNIGASQLVYDVEPASWVWLRVRLSTICEREARTTTTSVRVGHRTAASFVLPDARWTWRRVYTNNAEAAAELLLEIGGQQMDLDRLIVTSDDNFSPVAMSAVPLRTDDIAADIVSGLRWLNGNVGPTYLGEQKKWVNLAIPGGCKDFRSGCNCSACFQSIDAAWAAGIPSLARMPQDGVYARPTRFPNGSDSSAGDLISGWQNTLREWARTVVIPRLTNGSVSGVFLGDEICCHNSSCWHGQLYPISSHLRSLLGNSALLQTNECQDSLTGGNYTSHGHQVGPPLDMIAPDLDILSVPAHLIITAIQLFD
jgi:hypothetical protein